MTANINPADCKKTFKINANDSGSYYSLPALAAQLGVSLSRLPVSLRIVLESVLRNCDGQRITPAHIAAVANWQPTAAREDEVPFVVSRVILQDLTGVPLLADLAAMRDAAHKSKINPSKVKPLVPVDLVVDHSIHVDHYATGEAAQLNMEIEFQRNRERYQFLKWGMHAFDDFRVIPPGIGICHQVNLEYLASGVMHKDGVYYPDTLVGADSHTTMIGGIGVVGWGVGGIEAEAAMFGAADQHAHAGCRRRASEEHTARWHDRHRLGCWRLPSCCGRQKSSASLSSFLATARKTSPSPTAPPSAIWRQNTARPSAFLRPMTKRSPTTARPGAMTRCYKPCKRIMRRKNSSAFLRRGSATTRKSLS